MDGRIAALRRSKDIGNDSFTSETCESCEQTSGMLEIMVEYRGMLEELDTYYETVVQRIPALEKRRGQKKGMSLFKAVLWIASIITSALIGTVLTWIMT
jgi:hypothetical protein